MINKNEEKKSRINKYFKKQNKSKKNSTFLFINNYLK